MQNWEYFLKEMAARSADLFSLKVVPLEKGKKTDCSPLKVPIQWTQKNAYSVNHDQAANIFNLQYIFLPTAIGEYDELLTMAKKLKLRWFSHISRCFGLTRTCLQDTVSGIKKKM